MFEQLGIAPVLQGLGTALILAIVGLVRDRDEQSQAAASAEARHGAFFATLDPKSTAANGRIEIDNLVIACRRSAARGDAGVAVPTLELAWEALNLQGPFSVGVELAAVGPCLLGCDAGSARAVAAVAIAARHARGRARRARMLAGLTRAGQPF